MADKVQKYAENGVTISKSPVYVGDEITVAYDGLLAKSGADTVHIHLGYGDNWDNKDYIKMDFNGDSFVAAFKVLLAGNLNMAFKDSAENWDNNSSYNYSFKVTKKSVRATKTSDEEVVAKKAKTKTKTAVENEAAPSKKDTTKTAAVKKTVRKTAKKAEADKQGEKL